MRLFPDRSMPGGWSIPDHRHALSRGLHHSPLQLDEIRTALRQQHRLGRAAARCQRRPPEAPGRIKFTGVTDGQSLQQSLQHKCLPPQNLDAHR